MIIDVQEEDEIEGSNSNEFDDLNTNEERPRTTRVSNAQMFGRISLIPHLVSGETSVCSPVALKLVHQKTLALNITQSQLGGGT